MKNRSLFRGFSKLNKEQRIDFLMKQLGQEELNTWLHSFEAGDPTFQQIIDELSENVITNYHMPFAIAPNFMVDGVLRTFPLVTEESSVVAALGKAAGFWAERGGFHTAIQGTEKKGQIHFKWQGTPRKLLGVFPEHKRQLLESLLPVTRHMNRRGGGVTDLSLAYLPHILPGYFQLDVSFETQDAMGANFINSVLEKLAHSLLQVLASDERFYGHEKKAEIIMSVLSNYTPDCRVKVWTECPVADVNNLDGRSDFASAFVEAVHIAGRDISRAVTHNKGILNGIDALAMATGNDLRAIEAGAHAYAARQGRYASLSSATISDDLFHFEMDIPLSVGVVGGITQVHPLAAFALKILDNPSAKQLMGYLAVAGMAANFSAVRALITSGIQHGHMKMHLTNIFHQLGVPENKRSDIQKHFAGKTVSYSEVENFLNKMNDKAGN